MSKTARRFHHVAVLMGGFILIGGIARFLSWRQLRNIDRMQDEL